MTWLTAPVGVSLSHSDSDPELQLSVSPMSACCELFSLPLLGNILQHFASLLIIGSTGGVLLVLLAWARYRLENNFR